MKMFLYYFLVFVGLIFSANAVSARPQLATTSIGWIAPADISCEPTSDHTCVVKEDACSDCSDLAFTFTDPISGRKQYQVRGGTKLVILNDQGQDLFYKADKATKRVEVAIVIPADWDQRPGHDGQLRPDKSCHMNKRGNFLPIVSLSCNEQVGASHEIQFQKGKECWSYQGNDHSFVGKFLSWQDITVKAFFETDEGPKDAKVKVYNLTSGRLEIPVTDAGSYPTPEGGNATFEIYVQIDRPYKTIHFHICAITEKM